MRRGCCASPGVRGPRQLDAVNHVLTTLARDLAILEKEYIVERLVPYDFSPRTAAVEVLALLRGR